MSNLERLVSESKRAVLVLEAIATGKYYGPSEDIQAGRDLHAAVEAMEADMAELRRIEVEHFRERCLDQR